MKLSKSKLSLVLLIEKAGYMFRSEINKSKYPDSMIDSLVSHNILSEFKGKITSPTQPSE